MISGKHMVIFLLSFVAFGCNFIGGGDSEADRAGKRSKPGELPAKCPIYTEWPFDDAEAKRRQEETAAALGVPVETRIPLGDGVYVDLVLIPAGKFVMGLKGVLQSNEPREEKILRPFYIGKYEITWRQYAVHRVKNATRCNRILDATRRGGADKMSLPVDTIVWDTCDGFCIAVSKALGCTVRLPGEAEWEFACRAGTTGRYIWNDTVAEGEANAHSWVGKDGKVIRRSPLVEKGGGYRANPWGAYDMIGNVREWVFDMYTDGEYFRTIRGSGLKQTVACRMGELRSNCMGRTGFRIAVDIDSGLLKLLAKERKKKQQTTTAPKP
ncbi:MAG: SUMF1/EgtB/PvdO family nonheme iron enzyme [Kiritimatiellia bacterium]|jgi:formylglycine-generating enzyme required for sulfatase activity|nr:SUMF1/EgtB/PvdO family nonheme iron enzyme [Kiritimatiellia bacterium]